MRRFIIVTIILCSIAAGFIYWLYQFMELIQAKALAQVF